MEWIVFIGFLILGMGFVAWIGYGDLNKFDVVGFGFWIGFTLWGITSLLFSLTGFDVTQQATEQVYPMEIIHNQIVTWVDEDNVAQTRPIDKFDIEFGDEEYVKVVTVKRVSKFFVDDEDVRYVLVIRR